MNHDDAANHACAHTKAGLKHMLPSAALVQELGAKGLGKVGAQVVCCACLNTSFCHVLYSIAGPLPNIDLKLKAAQHGELILSQPE